MSRLEIFLVAPPGLEPMLEAEARRHGLAVAGRTAGGVFVSGDWADVWTANLMLRGATRVLVRLAEFRVSHLAQLDKRARGVDWARWLQPDTPVRVDAVCRKSKIYHSGAAAERIARAIQETSGAPTQDDAPVRIQARLDHDVCTLSLDSSGEPLHKRGRKPAVAKAPMRETLAALFLRACEYSGDEPLIDPMCGSGTFLLESAEIAAGLPPGRDRPFAFEQLANFDEAAWRALRADAVARATKPASPILGFDRDPGAVRAATENAQRAGLADFVEIRRRGVADLTAPPGPAGLVIVNPPYGARIGDQAALRRLYRTLGQRLKSGFNGWRVGLITSVPGLAKATGLRLRAGPPIDHGGLKVRLYQTSIPPAPQA